ncbi:hypothetical protein E0Z10_g330 [Xylaria hypoxylon]|uniref:Uncharacterized protein n=1 Tax=Xylaria hypoxylon TaxID=37992 RepID=A0A4Z0Z883_9PEZI|nr:hypothetical protein E0Z10_g330 [Xylaria hypoxylon]
MQLSTYMSIIVAIVGVVRSAPAPADGNAALDAPTPEGRAIALKKTSRSAGRFKPVWVVGFDEDEEKGEHIRFRLFSDRDKDSQAHGDRMKSHNNKVKSHNSQPKDHDNHKSSFWYYYIY